MARFRSFEQFSKRMQVIAAGIITNSNAIKQRTALVLDRDLVLATPVDTGHARSNWHVSVENPSDEISSIKDPEYTPGPKEEGIISAAVPGQSIYVTNNLPYMGALNDGHSAQAPAGFVEEAILNASRFMSKQKVLSP